MVTGNQHCEQFPQKNFFGKNTLLSKRWESSMGHEEELARNGEMACFYIPTDKEGKRLRTNGVNLLNFMRLFI